MRNPNRQPALAAILVHTSRAALGIGTGATLVMIGLVIARLIGYPMRDHTLGDAAFIVWCVSAGVYIGCLLFARFVDRKRGL